MGTTSQPSLPTLSAFLSILKLGSAEALPRLNALVQEPTATQLPLVPWHTYVNDPLSRLLRPPPSIQPLVKDDCNAQILWHAVCIELTANMKIFELAAGRSGADMATKALHDIAEWSQTATARRACIHAAQIYRILSNRKVSDSIKLHTVTALFGSALVLGLYLFMGPQSHSVSASKTFELLDEVDWARIDDLGLSTDGSSVQEYSPAGLDALDPAIDFIKNGGAISMAGAVHQGGYQSARRVLLDYANLMEGMGSWKLRTFSQVLHIMSDDLMSVDSGDDAEDF